MFIPHIREPFELFRALYTDFIALIDEMFIPKCDTVSAMAYHVQKSRLI